MRNVLLVAFHFPPLHGSSGLQRTLSLCQCLPVHGWQPSVITASTRAYERVDEGQLRDVPDHVVVERAFALDSARHLSIKGRYVKATALPDRWVSWMPSAVMHGLALIRRLRPAALWSTYPIATAHLIAATLQRLSGLPWIADFRDPMVEVIEGTGELYPADPVERNVRLWIERLVAKRAACSVFCTATSRDIFATRQQAVPDRLRVIENGFDERIFAEVEAGLRRPARSPDHPIVLLHSGILYPSADRNPRSFFDAISILVAEKRMPARGLRVVLRATGYDEQYRRMIDERDLGRIVRLEPPVGYRDALAEMMTADGLLLFQGRTSNPAIPAKAYEYLRAKRPVFALVDSAGETAGLLARTRTGLQAPLDQPDRIAQQLALFWESLRADGFMPLAQPALQQYSREARTGELASLLEAISPAPPGTSRPAAH